MRVTREAMEAHREGILAAAGRLFRARGLDGVGVAEIMKEAGLTHGGFYGHYASKTALAASACRRSLAESAARWRERGARLIADQRDPIEAIVTAYLAEANIGNPAGSCAVPTLGAEALRAGPPVSTAMAEGIGDLVDALASLAPAGTADPRACAWAAMSAMTGGMLLARAADNPAEARAILAAARELALQAFPPLAPQASSSLTRS